MVKKIDEKTTSYRYIELYSPSSWLALQYFRYIKIKAPCKRTQYCWPTTPNTVGCYTLHPFAHPVACCYVLLGVVAQSLKPVRLVTVYNLFPAVQYTVKITHYWKK